MPLRLTSSYGPLRCATCGYNLAGVGGGQIISECPECGTPFDPGDGARPRRWPSTWKLGLGLCGGMLTLGLLYIVAWIVQRIAVGQMGGSGGGGGGGGSSGAAAFVKELVVILDQCALAVWFLTPVLAAVILVQRYAYRGERWMIGLGLTIAGIVGNTVLAMAAMLFIILIR